MMAAVMPPLESGVSNDPIPRPAGQYKMCTVVPEDIEHHLNHPPDGGWSMVNYHFSPMTVNGSIVHLCPVFYVLWFRFIR